MNNSTNTGQHPITLTGPSGGKLLGFLAALGTLRTLSLVMPENPIRMSWQPIGGGWRPILHFSSPLSQIEMLRQITNSFEMLQQSPDAHPAMLWLHWLSEATNRRSIFNQSIGIGSSSSRSQSDWLASIGTDIILADQESSDSAFRASRSDYLLGNIKNIISTTTTDHLEKALFKPWTYDDSMDNLSLKFDASEDRRYALQWSAPSSDPDRKRRGNMLGANRLAIEAIPLFPTTVDGTRLVTTGFSGNRSTRQLTWCVWESPLGLDAVRSVLALTNLCEDKIDSGYFSALGIPAVFRCRRETIGKTRIFTPAFTV